MTRMTDSEEDKRAGLENAIANLTRSLLDLDLVELRLNQLRVRGGMYDLVDPAINEIHTIRKRTLKARKYLTEKWNMEWKL